MTENDAIEELKFNNEKCLEQCEGACFSRKNNDCACQDTVIERMLDELLQYRAIGTVEECRKSVKEEDVLKFYYCESKDDYYIGKRVGNFYYARYGETGFEWFMSRYLPWGEHVVSPHTLWKEYTYPSEPKEIPFFEWLQGFLKKYCPNCGQAIAENLEGMEDE